MLLGKFVNGVKSRGTGTLIGERYFITAAHCFLDEENGRLKEDDASFFLGITTGEDQSQFYHKKALINQVRIHRLYIEGIQEKNREKQLHYDLAVAKIDQDFGKQEGWASLKVLEDKQLINLSVNVTGYPSPGDTHVEFHTYHMYTMEGQITTVDPYRIHYDIDTSGGQSGAGIWKIGSNNVVDCVGVHANGFTENDMHNNATRINIKNFDMITKWLKEMEKSYE